MADWGSIVWIVIQLDLDCNLVEHGLDKVGFGL